MLSWLTNILRGLLTRTAPKGGGGAALRRSIPGFNPDRRFFGMLDEMPEKGTLPLRTSQEAEAAHASTVRPAWQDERVDLPFRRRSSRKQAPTGDSGVTHKVIDGVTHTGARSKGAERQARYRAKDPDGYRLRHREYMAARRAKAKSKETLSHARRSRCGRS
jgi:hypothetical protein